MDTTQPSDSAVNLTNCELEPIHLIGSVQSHGFLLAVREADGLVIQVSRNVRQLLQRAPAEVLDRPLAALGGDLADRVAHLVRHDGLADPQALQCVLEPTGQPRRRFEGAVHRVPGGTLVVELEPLDPVPGLTPATDLPPEVLAAALSTAVQRFSSAATLGTLSDAVVQALRDITGYDRVMV